MSRDEITNPKTNPMNYPVPHNILLLVIDGFEKPYDPEDLNRAISTPSIPSVPTDVAHGRATPAYITFMIVRRRAGSFRW